MYYNLSVYGLLCILLLAIILLRHAIFQRLPSSITDRIPERFTRSNYTPLTTFAGQRAAGLNSSNFDIEADNMEAGDSRMGLDEAGAEEVRAIMRSHRVNFDQARLIRQNHILARNGIAPDGTPLDSKAITRL